MLAGPQHQHRQHLGELGHLRVPDLDQSVKSFDRVGLTAPDNGKVFTVGELDRKMSALVSTIP